ncbi:MAG: ferredoxin [Bacilli bacterium]|nr:ferredoxin [Bacilli bacterium]
MKVKVNKDICIGCGACSQVADKIFTMGDDGLAEVIETVNTVPEEEKDNCIDAYESCPVGAIEIIEE